MDDVGEAERDQHDRHDAEPPLRRGRQRLRRRIAGPGDGGRCPSHPPPVAHEPKRVAVLSIQPALRDQEDDAVRRAYRNGRIKHPKTDASIRAVPLRATALEALDALPRRTGTALLFPAPRGGHINVRNFRNRDWKPAQRELGIDPSVGSTISDTALPRSHSEQASPPSTSRATWEPG